MGKKKVLIVEDEPMIRAHLGELLEFEGYEVGTAAHGGEAIDTLVQTEVLPHVILLDLMMPICSGYEFLELLKKEPRLINIPIVIMSAASNGPATAQDYHADFVRKPLDADALLKVIEKFVLLA